MQTVIVDNTFGRAWFRLLGELYSRGDSVSPRGQEVHELTRVCLTVKDARWNVFISPERNLNYKFMVAEWLWIWFGHDDVETIARYNGQITQFSDNGKTFAGAYGPKVWNQWPYIVGTLKRDLDSRQAVLQVYEQPNGITRDVPCTLSLQFLVRRGRLETSVCMRSSDIWLGLPYDFFNFSMFANTLATTLNVKTGPITFYLGSSHLYERNRDDAVNVLRSGAVVDLKSPMISTPPEELHQVLIDPTIQVPVLQNPWHGYTMLLQSPRADSADILWRLHDLAT